MGGIAFKPRPLGWRTLRIYENIHLPRFPTSNNTLVESEPSLGGGDSAVDWALAFENCPNHSFTIRDNFRALEHSVRALQESSVTIKTPFVLANLSDGKTLDKLEIAKSNQMKPKLSK